MLLLIMKYFLLVVILFLIAFNAIAKVEVWLCNSKHGIDVFKIDITEPYDISQRINRSWKKFLTSEQKTEVADVVYEPQNQLIKIIYNFEIDKKEIIFNLESRELIIKYKDKNKLNSKWSCELK